MAALAIAAVGSGVGGAIGGSFLGVAASSWGYMIGSIIGSMLFGPEGEDQHGPRLKDATYSGDVEGTDMPILWGGDRLPGKPIWIKNPPLEVKKKEDAGGKGGGGGSVTTYTYFQDFAVCFGSFNSQPPRRIWMNQELVYDASGSNTSYRKAGLAFSWYSGDTGEIDSLIEQYVGAGNAPAYSGRCVMVFQNLPLSEGFGNRLPVIEAELQTTATGTTSTQSWNVGPADSGSLYGADHVLRHPTDDVFISTGLINTLQNPQPLFITDMVSQYSARWFDGITWACNNIEWFYDPWPDTLKLVTHVLYSRLCFGGGCNTGTVYKLEYPSGKLVATYTYSGAGGIKVAQASKSRLLFYPRDASAGYNFINTQTMAAETARNISTDTSAVITDAPTFFNTGTACIDFYNAQWGVFNNAATGMEYWIVDYNLGSPTVTRKNSDLFSSIAPLDSGQFQIQAGGTPSCPVYIEENDEIWAPYAYIGTVYDDSTEFNLGLVCLNASTGAVNFWVDFVRDGYTTGSSYWGGLSGYPHLHFDPNQRRIWWALSGTSWVGSISVDSRTIFDHGNVGLGSAWAISYPNRNSIWSAKTTSGDFIIEEKKLSIIGQGDIAISEIVADICERCGLVSAEYDVSALTGKSVGSFLHSTRHSGRKDIEVLLGIAQADAVQSDNKIKFVLRGGAVDVTLPEDDLGAQIVTNLPKPKDPVTITLPMETEIPQVFEVSYRSRENNYTQAIAQSFIATGTNIAKRTAQLPLALSDQQASDVVEIYHQQMIDPKPFAFDLPIKYAYLEPTDIVEIPKNGKNYRVRITSVARGANWLMNCKGVSDRTEDQTSSAVAPGIDAFLGEILTQQNPQGLILDGPLLRDSDLDHPGPYLSSFVYGSNYPAAGWFYSVDNAVYNELSAQAEQPFVGICDSAHNGTVWEQWDDGFTVRVTVLNGVTLSSSTKGAIEADPTINAFAYGRPGRWEYLNFATVTVVTSSPLVYDLSVALRGRRGTNNFIDAHEAKDYLIKLDTTGTFRQTLQNSQIGNTLFYRVAPSGVQNSDVPTISNTIEGNTLKPYSPIQLEGTLHTTTDWAASTAYALNDEVVGSTDDDRRYVCTTAGTSGVTEPSWNTTIDGTTPDNTAIWTAKHLLDFDVAWTRRTRRGGSLGGDNTLTDGVGGPLEEDSKEYEIDFVKITDESILRSVTGLTTEAYEYLGTDQETDGADTLGKFYMDVYQMSAVVGRGYRARETFSRGWPEVLNAYLDLGASAIFQLNDAGGSTAEEYVSKTSPGTYTSATTDRAVTADNKDAACLKLDGSGYMKTGTTLSGVLSGKTKATLCYFLFSSSTTSNERFIELTQGGSGERWKIQNGGGAISQFIKPLNGLYTNSTAPSVNAEQFKGATLFVCTTVDISGTGIVFRHFVNGVYTNQTSITSGNLAYASSFQTQTRDTAYNDTVGATIASSPTNISTSGGIGMIAIWDSIVSDTDIASIWTAHKASIETLYVDDPACVALTKFEQETAPTNHSTWTAEKGSSSGFQWKQYQFGAKKASLRIGCNYAAEATHQTAHWLYRDLATVEKVQTFSWEMWLKPYASPSGTEWILSLGPRDWDGSTKRGFHILNDATTNGLTVRIGDGNASFTDYSAGSTNITSTTVPYHVVVTVDATNGIKAYIDGTEVFNSSGTTHTINWTDNTSGWPDVGTAYLKTHNNTSSQTSPNGTGLRASYNGLAFWDKELSATEITNLYKRGRGVVT